MSNPQNPLTAYFRTPKLYTTIPSGGKFYTEDILEMPPNGELAVFPMTSRDEVFMKNPDALLNGEAVASLINSCVPCVKDPMRMFTVDIDTLLVAIRGASSGDSVEVSSTCPACGHVQEFAVSIDAALSTQQQLERVYQCQLENGLTVVMTPLTYSHTVRAGIASFQNTRSIQNISEIQDDIERLKVFNTSFMNMADLNFQLMAESIQEVRLPDGGDIITDTQHIKEFVESVDNESGKQIANLQKQISATGVNNEVDIQCAECEHTHSAPVNFDPVAFFTAS